MNAHFINVKVDREERPDVDKVYMTFVQATTGSGGWPLSLFLTPDLNPVFGGTYFPPQGQFGRPGFTQILTALADQWEDDDNRVEMVEAGQQVLVIIDKQLGSGGLKPSPDLPSDSVFSKFYSQLSHKYDPEFGGYSKAPKFPQPSNLMTMFRLQNWFGQSLDRSKKGLEMNLHTLRMMAKGGIHDHISQGFARYSTDKEWHVPHFEKMLYDQAQLVIAYTTAYMITEEPGFKLVVEDILTYVTRDLSHPLGGFFSAEDADSLPLGESEGSQKMEGAFCVYEYQDIKKLLNNAVPDIPDMTLADIVIDHYNIREGGNVDPRGDPHGELKGKNVLTELPSKTSTIEPGTFKAALETAKQILFTERQKRPRPGLDDKILCSWNSLMISAFALAGSSFNRQDWLDMGLKAGHFLKDHLYLSQEKILLRSVYGAGSGSSQLLQLEKPIQGFIDDYCFTVTACLDLYNATLDISWLVFSKELQDRQDEMFLDSKHGGYFASKSGDPEIVLRLKDDQDGAEPSSNSVSAMNLFRLARLLGVDGKLYEKKAEDILKLYSERLDQMPVAMPALVDANLFRLQCTGVLILTGELNTHPILTGIRSQYIPSVPLLHWTGKEDLIRNIHQEIAGLEQGVEGAYLLRNGQLSDNIQSVEKLKDLLKP